MNWQQLLKVGKHLVVRVEMWLKAGIKPAPDRQIVGVVTDLFRSKQELITENAFLRQQLIILKLQPTIRPAITQQDRRMLVVLASKLHGWQDALHVVKLDTLLKWHRQGFRLFWRWKSKSQIRRPRIAPETLTLSTKLGDCHMKPQSIVWKDNHPLGTGWHIELAPIQWRKT